MRRARHNRFAADEILSPEAEVDDLLLVPEEGAAEISGTARYRAWGRQMEQWVGVSFLSVPNGIPPVVPVTRVLDSEHGLIRVPTHSRVPTMKQVLLGLSTCEYCGEATDRDASTCCPHCDGIYGDLVYDADEINP